MLREPSGCFEQTSSTNYPNVMIMQYLKQHDVADATLIEPPSELITRWQNSNPMPLPPESARVVTGSRVSRGSK